jgi:hypothetical protein
MRILDADDMPLEWRGTRAVSDIVQFVEYRRHAGDTAELARETLEEVPDQLVRYMRRNGIEPGGVTRQSRLLETDTISAVSQSSAGSAVGGSCDTPDRYRGRDHHSTAGAEIDTEAARPPPAVPVPRFNSPEIVVGNKVL